MKKVLFLFFLLFTTSCVSQHNSFSSHPPSPQEVASKALESTVALVLENRDGKPESYCSGVWINSNTILTAAHCGTAAQEIMFNRMLPPALRSMNMTYRDTSGLRVSYSMSNELPKMKGVATASHEAQIIATDGDHDLALIRAFKDDMPPHKWLHINENLPQVGDKIYMMGHPGGLHFTFMDGMVSAVREAPRNGEKNYNDKDDDIDLKPPFIQIFSGMYFGNSGGPVLNEEGEIIGIASFMYRVPNQGFAIGSPSIRTFIFKCFKSNKCKA